jgi:hypothetical protein
MGRTLQMKPGYGGEMRDGSYRILILSWFMEIR